MQKNADDYGKFEEGNKLSLQELQRYLDGLPSKGGQLDFQGVIYPHMKKVASKAVRATWKSLNK